VNVHPKVLAQFVKRYGREPTDKADLIEGLTAISREHTTKIADLPAPDPSKPLAKRLPGAAVAAVDGRVKPTKEWLADVEKGPKRDRPFVPSEWKNHCLTVIERERVEGDPSKSILTAFTKAMVTEQNHDNNGFVVVTFWFIARWLLGCWPATAQRCVRWMVDHGLICPQPTRVRDGRMIVNGPNAYTLQMPDEVPGEDAPEVVPANDPAALALSVMRRIARAWDYWRPRFGLHPRPTGWANTSPLRQWKDDDPLPA